MIPSPLDYTRMSITLKCGFKLLLSEVDVVNVYYSQETVFGSNLFDQLQYSVNEKNMNILVQQLLTTLIHSCRRKVQ